MIPGLLIIEREIKDVINSELHRVGLLYRLFSRAKDSLSLEKKIIRKNNKYQVEGPKVQDIIGIRVVTYFIDDIDIVYSALKDKFKYIDETIDDFELTVFKPRRNNIICEFNPAHNRIFEEIQETSNNDNFKLVDNTFELQLRTMLSEGWHEIDHNLRYKSSEDWNNYPENERLLNGIYASLETNDQTLNNLFNELSYKHYKNQNWEGMLRTKFRLQFQQERLNKNLIHIFDNDASLTKEIFKLDRVKVLKDFACSNISLPINFNNIIYLINYLYLKKSEITKKTPELILSVLNHV